MTTRQAPSKQAPWGAILSFVSAIAYGISPIDLIPDVILLLGWVDDAIAVPLLVLFGFYLLWKRGRSVKKEDAIVVQSRDVEPPIPDSPYRS